jgi:ArsR family transcriptional regulator, arsenate/arsenite/antimonite-responsive transcriptional repressor
MKHGEISNCCSRGMLSFHQFGEAFTWSRTWRSAKNIRRYPRYYLDYICISGYTYPMKQTARMFKALADETRLRILGLLLSEGELCVCDIMAALTLPQSTISRHMAYLRTSGWVDDRRSGLWVHYKITAAGSDFQREIANLLGRCLPEVAVAGEDRKRLVDFAAEKKCV